MESNTALICPDCKSDLLRERMDTPWCECGWTSQKDEWEYLKLPEKLKARIDKDQKNARKYAQNDAEILRDEKVLKKSWSWKFYFFLSVLLSLPFITFQLIFWLGLGSGIVLSILSGSKSLVFMMGLVTVSVVLYQVLVIRDENKFKGIVLTPQSTPLFFREIEGVAEKINIQLPAKTKVVLILEANASMAEKFEWRRLKFEPVLTLGLLTLFAVNISELRAIIAHELAHLQNRDNLFLHLIRHALQTLDGMLKSRLFANFWIPGIILEFLIWKYLQLLTWTSYRAIRRQEYMADKTAALTYGKTNTLHALIMISAIGLKYREYLPLMVQNIRNKLDQHDFYTQFVNQWEALTPKLREGVFARAMLERYRTYATHPTYRDRRNALATMENTVTIEQNDQSALTLIDNPYQYGVELTKQVFKFWSQKR